HAVEQWGLLSDYNIDYNNHPEAHQAPKIGSRAFLYGLSCPVNEQKLAPQRTDVGKPGRRFRVFGTFTKLDPDPFLEIVDELHFVQLAFRARGASSARVRRLQFLHLDLACPERVLDGQDLGEIQ